MVETLFIGGAVGTGCFHRFALPGRSIDGEIAFAGSHLVQSSSEEFREAHETVWGHRQVVGVVGGGWS